MDFSTSLAAGSRCHGGEFSVTNIDAHCLPSSFNNVYLATVSVSIIPNVCILSSF